MTTIFISGSMQIKNIDEMVLDRIRKIIESNFCIILGDADGVDQSIQTFLHKQLFKNVIVYCTGPQPRNNVGGWKLKPIHSNSSPGTRAYFTAKDVQLAKDADYGLMIWDTKSTGTLGNVIELLSQNKKSVVFINKEKTFKTVTTVSDLESLLLFMSESALMKAEEKLKIRNKIHLLQNVQGTLI